MLAQGYSYAIGHLREKGKCAKLPGDEKKYYISANLKIKIPLWLEIAIAVFFALRLQKIPPPEEDGRDGIYRMGDDHREAFKCI